MQYHTALIILHRPARNMLQGPEIGQSEAIRVCYQALETITKLLRSFSRNYRYNCLPLTFVYILASASSVVLMKQHIECLSWDDPRISKPLELVSEAVEDIAQTWPCARQVAIAISAAKSATISDPVHANSSSGYDVMATIAAGGGYEFDQSTQFNLDDMENIEDFLNPGGYFNDLLDWSNATFP